MSVHAWLAAAAVGVGLVGGGAGPTAEETAWVRERAVVVEGAEAGAGFEDLRPLKAMIGEARIVSLGEPTHGTREAFQFKHRLLEFLVEEMGFSIFSIEASMPEACAIDAWVLGETGEGTDAEAARLIGGMYFWTWNTEEVLAMVKWMRAWNDRQREAGSERRVHFTGFDMQTPNVAMDLVKTFVREHDRESTAMVEACYERALRFDPLGAQEGGAAGFGVATGTFPAQRARGKRVVYSGFIRTRGVKGGHAGLWWRCDGPEGDVLAFDNMTGRGPSGDTEWARYEVAMDVPEGTTNINFGVIMTGKGEAWFDDLAIELDGVKYAGMGAENLDFEVEQPATLFSPPPASHAVKRAEGEGHGGKASLKIESVAAVEDAGKRGVDGREAERLAKKVLDHLRGNREALAEAAGERQADWAIQNARVVWQCYRMYGRGATAGGFSARDSAMADNVEWLLDHGWGGPDAKIVLWAHNAHVARIEGHMGKFLEAKFPGREMFVLGFATSEGTYTAISAKGAGLRQDLPLLPPPEESVEAVLGSAGIPSFVIDLREAASHPGGAWALEHRPMRSVGALEMAEQQFFPSPAAEHYDGLVYQHRTTAAVQLKTAPARVAR